MTTSRPGSFASFPTAWSPARLHRLLQLLGGHGQSLASGLSSVVGGTPEELPALYRLISPATHVDAVCPPTLLL